MLKYKITNIEPKSDFKLAVKFENGVKKIFDVKPYFSLNEVYEPLKNQKKFQQVKVECKRLISWDDFISIDGTDAWEDGEIIND
jgi:hypothetical protein